MIITNDLNCTYKIFRKHKLYTSFCFSLQIKFHKLNSNCKGKMMLNCLYQTFRAITRKGKKPEVLISEMLLFCNHLRANLASDNVVKIKVVKCCTLFFNYFCSFYLLYFCFFFFFFMVTTTVVFYTKSVCCLSFTASPIGCP